MQVFFISVIVSLLLRCNARAVLRLPENVTIPAVFAFGDSTVDAGNNNYIETWVRSNFPPYGRDFLGGKATGRFSNGKLPSDLIVEALGIKELLPPYLDPNLKMEDLLTGVNFGSGGAGYDHLTSEIMLVISLPNQLKLFREYTELLKGAVGEANATAIIANSIFLVAVGSNDLANTYFSLPGQRLRFDIPSYTDFLLNASDYFLQELYGVGARWIGVSGVPPVGCLPSQRTLAGGTERECAEDRNGAAQMFNEKLLARMGFLNCHLPGVKIVYVDIYNALLNLIQNPQTSGFKVVSRGCCGTGILEVSYLCNPLDPLTCKNVSEYVFWDSYHPTEKAYRIFMEELGQKLIDGFFCGGLPC